MSNELRVLEPGDRGDRPERVAYALELMTADVEAETRTMQLAKRIAERFRVSSTTAIGDIKLARIKLAERMNEAAPYLGAYVKDTLLRLARKAEIAADFKAANDAMAKLGKFLGLHERSDRAEASGLSDAQLAAQLDAAIRAKVQAMTPDELAAYLAVEPKEP